MPSLIDMRRRIRAVKSTQQITKAMKMVAASKLRRAQERVVATRPFAREARRVLASIAARVDARDAIRCSRAGRAPRPARRCSSSITADRGLCGSFNTNIIKAVGAFLRENRGRPVSLGLVGRKGRDILGPPRLPGAVRAREPAEGHSLRRGRGHRRRRRSPTSSTARVDSVHLVYNEFKSVMQQKLVVEQLLPLAPVERGGGRGADGDRVPLRAVARERIFDALLPRLVEAQMLRALLESNAAFYAAQMTAMDAATRNSTDMIDSLTLYMNKIRQAAITREIIEVVSGAQAL